jgi:hypothetical protein
MLDYHVLTGISLGIGFSLLILTGIMLNHFLEARAYRKRACAIVDPEGHRREGERLLRLAFRSRDPKFAHYLRNEALCQFIRADQMENGPYFH